MITIDTFRKRILYEIDYNRKHFFQKTKIINIFHIRYFMISILIEYSRLKLIIYGTITCEIISIMLTINNFWYKKFSDDESNNGTNVMYLYQL